MSENSYTAGRIFAKSTVDLHRLRRYPHNGITKSTRTMGGRMLNGENRRTTYFVLSILLVSSLPMLSTVSASDVGTPSDLQAQDIDVTFDNVSETTTVTWRNIAQTGGDIDLYAKLWDATYHVYRHDAPITPANIDDLTPWHSVVACDQDEIGQSVNCVSAGSNPHPGHSATFQVGAGTDGNFYYAITTEHGNGSISASLDFNASSLYEPVNEVTTPIRSPYNVQANFNPATSQTTKNLTITNS